jgi:hypothetical protein
MTTTMTPLTDMPARLRLMRRNMLLAVPFHLLVIAGLYLLVSHLSGGAPAWGALGAGALGWLVALALRGPIAVAALKLAKRPEAGQSVVVGASGPLEEGVRLGVLVLLGASLPTALAVGLGWAVIEVVFAIVNGFVGNLLLSKDDDKAREAIALLEAQGMLRETGGHWGVIERVFASLAHLGFTLLAAAAPWWLLLTIPVHSAMNLSIQPLVKKGGLPLAEAVVALLGLTLFVGGWVALNGI